MTASTIKPVSLELLSVSKGVTPGYASTLAVTSALIYSLFISKSFAELSYPPSLVYTGPRSNGLVESVR